MPPKQRPIHTPQTAPTPNFETAGPRAAIAGGKHAGGAYNIDGIGYDAKLVVPEGDSLNYGALGGHGLIAPTPPLPGHGGHANEGDRLAHKAAVAQRGQESITRPYGYEFPVRLVRKVLDLTEVRLEGPERTNRLHRVGAFLGGVALAPVAALTAPLIPMTYAGRMAGNARRNAANRARGNPQRQPLLGETKPTRAVRR